MKLEARVLEPKFLVGPSHRIKTMYDHIHSMITDTTDLSKWKKLDLLRVKNMQAATSIKTETHLNWKIMLDVQKHRFNICLMITLGA